MKVSFGSNLFPKPPFSWEGRRQKKISICQISVSPDLFTPSSPQKKEKEFNLPTWIFSSRYRPQIFSSFSHRSPGGTHFDVTPSRFFDGDIRKHTTIMGSRKSLAMVHVGDFLPSKFPTILRLQATGHDVFSFQGSNSIQPPHPKKVLHTHTHTKKKRPLYVAWLWRGKKKSAGSFFECVYFQDTLTTRKTIQVQHRDSQVHLLLLTGLVEHDEAILSQCFITTSVLWFQSTVPAPENSTCHPGSWLGIARLHKPPNM